MTEYAKPVDIATSSVLRQIAEQVRRTRQPVPLTQHGEVVAVVQPAPAAATSPPSAEDVFAGYDPEKVLEGLRASAGALTGIDREELLTDIHAQRARDSEGRPE
jgi:hypothetical protein